MQKNIFLIGTIKLSDLTPLILNIKFYRTISSFKLKTEIKIRVR